MKAIWNDTVIAQSNDTVIVEQNHYFPADSVDDQLLVDSDHTSICPWKGTANYYHVEANGETNANAAWYYTHPKSAAKEIEGRIAFWKGVQVVE
jgi:uncharacterized protein (DUF427 family)